MFLAFAVFATNLTLDLALTFLTDLTTFALEITFAPYFTMAFLTPFLIMYLAITGIATLPAVVAIRYPAYNNGIAILTSPHFAG